MELKISSVCTHLRPLISCLLNNNIGIIADDGVRICDLASGRPFVEYCLRSSSISDVADRFKLKISYAGKTLVWDVIFNSLSPKDAPDFNFNDDDLMRIIGIDDLEKFVPSLTNWKYDDPFALRNCIAEFITLYKRYQYDQLKEDNFCLSEYFSLLKTGLVEEKDIEVMVLETGFHFLIRLYPDLMDYKVLRYNEHPELYAAHITAYFSTSSPNKIAKPQVSYTSLLQDCFVSRLPVINVGTISLAEYVIKLNEKIEELLSPSLLKPVAKRKRFIFEWLSYFGTEVIEFDALNFKSVSFLLDQECFCYMLVINVPNDFPSSPPEYKLQSIYSSPLIISVKQVPYNPNWVFKVMVSKAIKYIVESEIPIFKKVCIENM